MPDPARIREKYCATSSGYDELYGDEQRRKYELVFTSHAPRGTILDVGAGTCLLLEYLYIRGLLRKVAYYIALDLTPCMLESCARRVNEYRLGHLVDIVEAEASHLPLRDKSVDESYAFTVFDLLPDPQQGIEEQVRVTRGTPVYTLLKKVERLRKASLCERYIGETDKDVVCLPRAAREYDEQAGVASDKGLQGKRITLTTPYLRKSRRNTSNA